MEVKTKAGMNARFNALIINSQRIHAAVRGIARTIFPQSGRMVPVAGLEPATTDL